jgi:trk system potassium uptake protein TrkH
MIASASASGAWSPPQLRPILYLIGGMLVALSATMLLPAAADLVVGNPDWKAFALSSAVTFAAGATLYVAFRCELTAGLTLRQAFVLTPMAWTAIALFGALPLYFSDYAQLRDSFANAIFESMSGLTATGATVIVGLDFAPPGVLLWRGLMQWLGGFGIIGMAIAILPALGVGGMQLFRTESSDRSEKVMPRVREIAAALSFVYLGLTGLCAILYWLAEMTPFEALVHALTTVATGGFSTSDSSMGKFGPVVHWIAIVFMLSGAIPFVLYVRLLRGEQDTLRDRQVRTFLAGLAAVSGALALWLVLSGQYGVGDALRHAAFNVVSIVTTTGYATTDYTLWGNVATGVFFALIFVGGCTGSTSGGIKIFRFEVMAIMLRAQLMRLIHPRGVFQKTYAGRLLPEDVTASIVAFLAFFIVCYSALTIALMAFDLDFLTSASAAATALANVGPGLGPIIGPAGNFATIPDGAKWLLAFGMLLGRLELFTVLVLFVPGFWRG